ncbi:MAG: hypothetical protein HND57_00160 [Planctomycetes bacterium]|nr:hypothetical protein [Planctomycetota bacterium]
MHHDDGIEPQHQCPPSVIVVSLVVFALLTASLAFTTSTLRHWRARTAPDSDTPTQVWDESYMVPVVQEIIRDNWSHASMLDYQDTKGPVLFWAYAAWGQVCGSEASSLRSLSMLLATLCAWPAALIAWRVWRYTEQTYRQKAWLTVLSVALIWLLPYQPVLSQLFMSEPLFNLLSLWAVACAIIGFERQTDPKRHALPWALTVAYTLVLVLLVHVRVQAVVIAGAVCLTAVLTVGIRGSACWWMASAIAGLSRIPLWLRWDGLVSPEFQDRYGLGFRLDALTYVVVAALADLGRVPVAPRAAIREAHAGCRRCGCRVRCPARVCSPAGPGPDFRFRPVHGAGCHVLPRLSAGIVGHSNRGLDQSVCTRVCRAGLRRSAYPIRAC